LSWRCRTPVDVAAMLWRSELDRLGRKDRTGHGKSVTAASHGTRRGDRHDTARSSPPGTVCARRSRSDSAADRALINQVAFYDDPVPVHPEDHRSCADELELARPRRATGSARSDPPGAPSGCPMAIPKLEGAVPVGGRTGAIVARNHVSASGPPRNLVKSGRSDRGDRAPSSTGSRNATSRSTARCSTPNTDPRRTRGGVRGAQSRGMDHPLCHPSSASYLMAVPRLERSPVKKGRPFLRLETDYSMEGRSASSRRRIQAFLEILRSGARCGRAGTRHRLREAWSWW